MNAMTRFFAQRIFFNMVAGTAVFGAIQLAGCSSSEEATMEEYEMSMVDSLQTAIDALQADNVALRAQLNRLDQENKNLTAKTAELETKLAEGEKVRASPRTDPKMEYERGLSLARERHYEEAASVFMGLLNTSPPEGLESNCHYWIGECYYGLKQYSEALPHFEQVLNYQQTTKKDDAQLMIANCFKRTGDKERAKQEYQKLIDQYPASPYVQRAKDEVAKL